MWDTTSLALKPCTGFTTLTVPQLHTVPYVRTSVARISYYAGLTTTTHAAFSQRKPHAIAQRHQPRQEIRETWAENDGKPFDSFPIQAVPFVSLVRKTDAVLRFFSPLALDGNQQRLALRSDRLLMLVMDSHVRRGPRQAIYAFTGIDQRIYFPLRQIDHRHLFGART
jgi:hypothetical protein